MGRQIGGADGTTKGARWSAEMSRMSMPQRCAVVGVGQTRHRSARKDVSMAGLVREAAIEALEDAGMTWSDIDAVVVGKAPDMFEGVAMPELYLADALGAVGKPLMRVHTAGSVGGSTAIVAAKLVEAGIHERVLTVAFEKQSESNATWGLSVPMPFAPPLVAGAGGYFAPIIRAYMYRSGAPRHIGHLVAVKDRLAALRNPKAHLHLPDIDLKTVEESFLLWDPLRYLDTCPSSDGAMALVMGSERVADAAPGTGRVGARHGDAQRADDVRGARPGEPAGRAATARPTSTSRPASPTRARTSTAPRCTCRSRGTSRCGSRTSGSARKATAGSSPRPARPRPTVTSRGTRRAACCRRTRSARRAWCASARSRSRCAAGPATTRSS